MSNGQIQLGIGVVAIALVTVLALYFEQMQSRNDKDTLSDHSPVSANVLETALQDNLQHEHSGWPESSQRGSELSDAVKIRTSSAGSGPEHGGINREERPRRLEISVTAGSVDVAAFRAQRIKVYVAAGELDVVAFEDPWLIARRNDAEQAEAVQFNIARLVAGGNSTDTDLALDTVQGLEISMPFIEEVLAVAAEEEGSIIGRTGMAGLEESGSVRQSTADSGQLASSEKDSSQEPLFDLAYVTDSQLEEHRGGFVLDNGIRIDFSIDRAAYVNDIEQFSNRFELPANLSNKTLSEVNAVQTGNSNLITLADTATSIDLIQNSVDNQVIRDVTKFDIRIENFNIMQRLDYAAPGFSEVDTPTILR